MRGALLVGEAVEIGRWEPGSPEWLHARRQGLGGSEIAAVTGVSPFESCFALWHRKAGNIGDVETNAAMEWGNRLEPVIAEAWAERHDEWEISDPGTLRHLTRHWHLANPDRLVWPADDHDSTTPAGILEIKLSLFGDGWGPDGSAEVPPHVWAQCHWYMAALGVERAWVSVLIGAADHRCYELAWDGAYAAELLDEGHRFIKSIEAGDPPSIDGHDETYRAVRSLHEGLDGTEVELPPEVAIEFVTAQRAVKTAEEAARQARSRVAAAMGEANGAACRGYKIAGRQSRGGGQPYVVAARSLSRLDPSELTDQPTAEAGTEAF